MPYEVLIKNNSGETDFTQLDYLIKDYEISYHYSATLFAKARRRQNSITSVPLKGFLGFAPVFSAEKNNGYILASSSDVLRSAESEDSLFRAIIVNNKKFRSLTFSEDEVSSIVSLFEKNKKPAIAYFHEQASEEHFKKAVSDYKYIHIATHGLMNDNYPKLSGLIFSQPKDSTDKEDGVLYSAETYNLNLNADLLVLSSCESGIGKLIKGEGLMALTRGFLYSGVQNMAVSLWKVSDRQTPELMREFYKNILDGKSYSAALRLAKLKMIDDKLSAFPRNWAGFVLIGQ